MKLQVKNVILLFGKLIMKLKMWRVAQWCQSTGDKMWTVTRLGLGDDVTVRVMARLLLWC